MGRLLAAALLMRLAAIDAQNFSGLEGRELTTVQDLDLVVSNGLLSLR